MRTYHLHGVMTQKRLDYLRAVEANEPYPDRHGVVANHCLRLGWVETIVRTPDGSLKGWDEIPPGEHSHEQIVGQRLTDEGREMLRKALTA